MLKMKTITNGTVTDIDSDVVEILDNTGQKVPMWHYGALDAEVRVGTRITCAYIIEYVETFDTGEIQPMYTLGYCTAYDNQNV